MTGIPMRVDQPRRRKKIAGQSIPVLVVRYVVLALIFLLMAGPFLYQLSTSLKGPLENIFAYPPQFLPKDPTLHNYATVAQTIPVWRYIGNSLIVAAISVTTNCIFGSMAGYVLARLRFRGRGILLLVFLSTMVIPFEAIFVSVFLIVKGMGLVDTLLAVALPSSITGLSIMLTYNAFRGIPKEIEEAAVIDGASDWQRYLRVAMPSIKGTLTVVAIFSFMFSWDDFLWPLIVLKNPNHFTLTVGIQYLSGTFTSNQRVIAAGSMIAVIPLLVGFFCLQKYFFKGVGEGAVKG